MLRKELIKFVFVRLIFLSLIISFDLFPSSSSRIKSQSLRKDLELNSDIKSFENVKKYNIQSIKENFLDLFKHDLIKFENQIINILIANESKDIEVFSMDIESDIQYQNEDTFFAEGNVNMYLGNGTLSADKISYDQQNKIFVAEGNIKFFKGEQYFEASFLNYDLNQKKGFIENIYGVLDVANLNKDFDLESLKEDKKLSPKNANSNLDDLFYINTASLGLVNDFEENKKFNITDLDLNVPRIPKWRFKSEKLIFESKEIKSDLIFFTNDPFNKPQLILESRNFIARVVNDKSQLISKNTWVNIDDKLKFPIGRRNIIDREPLTKWGLGSDFKEKDGWYVFRGFENINLSKDYSLKLQPYFLIQRALKGETNSFRASNSSIFSPKINKESSFFDYIALDMDLKGKISNWNLLWDSSLNSLDLSRINESLKTKITLSKTIDLISDDSEKSSLLQEKIIGNNNFGNYLDFKFYSTYRETVSRGYDGDSEIYFGSGLSIANRKEWNFNNVEKGLALIYDLGIFNAKSRTKNELKNLKRNLFAIKYNYKFPIWEKENINRTINSNYKYSPSVINEGFNWSSSIQTGAFFYSNGDAQKAITFNTGPELIIGSFVEGAFDYTKLNLNYSYILKDGESPYEFDNINDSNRIQFNLEQQMIGPLLLSYETTLDLENGVFSKPNYGLDIKRRAYSVGAFYNTSSRSVGIKFNIFNFDFSGKSPRF